MQNIVHTEYDGTDRLFTVAMYGPDDGSPARRLAVELGADMEEAFLIKSASTASDTGFRKIWHPTTHAQYPNLFDAYVDAVHLTDPEQSAIHFTADCPVVVIYDAILHQLIATHAGRPAMSPSNEPSGPISNIITDCWRFLNPMVPNEVNVIIVGSIAAEDFRHNHPEARALTKPFEQFGDRAFEDHDLGTIDLPWVITEQLAMYGVPRRQIQMIGPFTSKTSSLASYRRDRTKKRNTIITVLH